MKVKTKVKAGEPGRRGFGFVTFVGGQNGSGSST